MESIQEQTYVFSILRAAHLLSVLLWKGFEDCKDWVKDYSTDTAKSCDTTNRVLRTPAGVQLSLFYFNYSTSFWSQYWEPDAINQSWQSGRERGSDLFTGAQILDGGTESRNSVSLGWDMSLHFQLSSGNYWYYLLWIQPPLCKAKPRATSWSTGNPSNCIHSLPEMFWSSWNTVVCMSWF